MLRKLFMSILIAASFAFPLPTTAATPPLSGLSPSAPHTDPLLAFTDPGDTYPLQAPAKPPAAKPPAAKPPPGPKQPLGRLRQPKAQRPP